MTQTPEHLTREAIAYSCYHTHNREGEQFVPGHILSYQISGTLTLNDGHREYVVHEGDLRFVKRNRLVKFNKQPPENGTFRSLSVFLHQDILTNFSREYNYEAGPHEEGDAILELSPDPLLKSYIDSLLPYENTAKPLNPSLLELKLKEAIMVLLQTKPDLKDILLISMHQAKLTLPHS